MKKAYRFIEMLIIALVVILITQSCTKGVRGCTDKKASNYNAAADEFCTSCCLYEQKDTVPSSYGSALFYSNAASPSVTLSTGKVIIASTGTGCTDTAATNRVSLAPGTYTYTANNAAGMGWSGSFIVTTGQCSTISLTAANVATGKIAFSTDNTGLGAITVTLDNNPAGNIDPYIYSPTYSGPGFDVIATPGPHVYTASSANGQSWSGTVNVISNNTTAISFERSNMSPVSANDCNIIFFTTVEPDYTVHFNNIDIGSGITYSSNGTPLSSQNWVVSTVVPFGTYGWWATTSAGKYFSGNVTATAAKPVVAVAIN